MKGLYSNRNDFHAVRWYKNGDHPNDNSEWISGDGDDRFLSEGHVVRYYRDPRVASDTKCQKCGHIMHDHGFIDAGEDGAVVCPGDWIINCEEEVYKVMSPDEFQTFIDEY